MTDDLKVLAEALVEDPFNDRLRHQYASALIDQSDWAAALNQFELLLKTKESAVACQGAAWCLKNLDRAEEAVSQYIRSKSFDDFAPMEELEVLVAKARPTTRFTVHDGDRMGNIVSLADSKSSEVGFGNVAGMDDLKKTLRLQIIEPFLNPGLFRRFRKTAGGGILLYGPPGCGKTLMARAIATECNATFQSIGISDVLNMWLGESERNLAVIFEQARANKPCVMFFDELDALAYSRSKSSSTSARTVVNEFLAQLDGFDYDNSEVLVLAATNMPWDVDPAIKRPGRFSRQIFVPPPDVDARQVMLEMKLADVPAEDVNYKTLAEATNKFSGADIDGLIDQAKDHALADILASGTERKLSQDDFTQVLDEVIPSTIEWLKTARNLVKYAGADNSYKDVAKYLKKNKLG